jgi:hypothetical protein
MRERVLRRALPASIGIFAVAAATASAGTFTVNPSVQGAGKITGPFTCEQAAGVSNDAIKTCTPWVKTNTTLDVELVTLTAEPAAGWTFSGWDDCAFPQDNLCKQLVPKDATWAVTRSPRAKFVDTQRPTVTFDPVVRWTNQERTVTVSWSADEPGVSYKCGLDGATATACTATQVLTAPACSHKYAVSATAPSGNAAKPVAIEVELLDTEITGGPAEGSFTNATNAKLTFTGAPTVECSLDGAPYTTCKPPLSLSGLAEGKHTVLARSRHGDVVDLIPAKRSWTVDTTAPETSLWLEDDAPTFSFNSSEAGSTFACSLDGAAFAPCTAPRPAAGLAVGTHEFAVKAIDRAGNEDPTPAKRRWTVEAPAPVVTPAAAPVVIAAAPAKLIPGLSFRYVAGRKGTTFTRLAVTGLPAGTRLTVIVTSPTGKKRTLSSLKPLIGKRLKPGTKIAVAGKTITIRRSRAPKVA